MAKRAMRNLSSCGGQLENRAEYFRAPKVRDDPSVEAINPLSSNPGFDLMKC